MSKLRILQFCIANTGGGQTQYILNNWKFINKDKFHFDFVTMNKASVYEKYIKNQGSNIYYLSCYAEDDAEKFTNELSEILANNYDIIHVHTSYWKSFLVEEIACACKVPRIIIHAHTSGIVIKTSNDSIEYETQRHYLLRDKLTEQTATDFWACSSLAADWLYGDIIPRDSIKILRNAIDVNKFKFNEKSRFEMRKILGLDGKFVIGNCGRFVREKNHNFLIEVFSKIHKQYNNTVLMLVGDGYLKDEIESQIQNLGISQAVIYTGLVENVADYLQAIDLILMPSLFEGFPIALIEAQAAGLHCIVSDTVCEEANLTGAVKFLPLDIEKWFDEIIERIKSYERIDRTGILIEQGFDVCSQVMRLENLYQEFSY